MVRLVLILTCGEIMESTLDIQTFSSFFCDVSQSKWMISEIRGEYRKKRMYLGCTMQEAVKQFRAEFPELDGKRIADEY
jgi:hypothetical protein